MSKNHLQFINPTDSQSMTKVFLYFFFPPLNWMRQQVVRLKKEAAHRRQRLENCRQRATINKNMRTMQTRSAPNIDFNMAAHTHTHRHNEWRNEWKSKTKTLNPLVKQKESAQWQPCGPSTHTHTHRDAHTNIEADAAYILQLPLRLHLLALFTRRISED